MRSRAKNPSQFVRPQAGSRLEPKREVMSRVTRRDRAIELFNPDEAGFSDWVLTAEFMGAGLPWPKNGNMRRGAAWQINDIKWGAKRRGNERSEILALRMEGWQTRAAFDQFIAPKIRKAMDEVRVCNISMLPVPQQDREIDHRFGNKEHPDYVELYERENQKFDDFQLLHRIQNGQKRQMCKTCVADESRPPHPTLGYAEGDASIPERFPCNGCFLAEPERFRGLN